MSTNSVFVEGTLFVCSKCKKPFYDIFKWSICQHPHCKKCLNTTINESLLTSNSLPQCKYPNCTQQLKLKDATSLPISLLTKYKSSTQNIEQLKREQLLIFGVTRNIVTKLPNNYKDNIAQDVIKLIHDFYNLNLHSIVPCDGCVSTGYKHKQEQITYKCTDCNLGMKYIECSECEGIGYKSFRINTGSGYVDCFRENCTTCSGIGKITSNETCTIEKCEFGFIHEYTTHKYVCKICKGKKYLLKLDFIKLCNNQMLCVRCKNYTSIDRIMYWSTYGHSYCMTCFKLYGLRSICDDLLKHIIPNCPETNCDAQFAENNIQIIQDLRNSRFTNIKITLANRLKEMYGIKQEFMCKGCKKYHHLNELQTCVNCYGNYGKKCANVVSIRWKDCAHVCCLDCVDSGHIQMCFGKKCTSTDTNYGTRFKCEMCKKVRRNRLFLWSNCKHTYCINCVKDYFGKVRNSVMIEGNTIFYARKKHLKHMGIVATPVCFKSNCNQLLGIDDYKSLKN